MIKKIATALLALSGILINAHAFESSSSSFQTVTLPESIDIVAIEGFTSLDDFPFVMKANLAISARQQRGSSENDSGGKQKIKTISVENDDFEGKMYLCVEDPYSLVFGSPSFAGIYLVLADGDSIIAAFPINVSDILVSSYKFSSDDDEFEEEGKSYIVFTLEVTNDDGDILYLTGSANVSYTYRETYEGDEAKVRSRIKISCKLLGDGTINNKLVVLKEGELEAKGTFKDKFPLNVF